MIEVYRVIRCSLCKYTRVLKPGEEIPKSCRACGDGMRKQSGLVAQTEPHKGQCGSE